MTARALLLLGVLYGLTAAGPAEALVLGPGQASFGLPATNPTAMPELNGPVVEQMEQPFSLTSNGQATGVTGRLINTVVREARGTLDFYYQVALDPLGPGQNPPLPQDLMIADVAGGGYKGFITDVFARNDASGQRPVFPRRSFDGNSLDFGFSFGVITNNLRPGESTAPFFVRSNGSEVRTAETQLVFVGGNPEAGTSVVFDGIAVPSFGPVVAVPEPGGLGVLGVGVGMLAWRRRREGEVRIRS